jgi:hypothetical protein
VAISGYSIGGYWWLIMTIIVTVIDEYYIVDIGG